MHIIAGKYKGRVFSMPRGIRPTQDKVRKALFDILGDIEGLSFLDLFAGSGSVGFEALSRGAAEAVFVEDHRQCQQAMECTIGSLKLENSAVYPSEVSVAVRRFHREGRKFDIVFLDPPYHGDAAKKTLQTLKAYDILAPYGFIVVQSFKKESLPHSEGDLIMFRQSRYGDTILSFYRKQ